MIQPLDAKAMYETWEKAASAWSDVWLRSPQVLSAMGKTLEAQLGQKTHADAAMASFLELWKIPSTKDLEALAARVRATEDRLAALEEKKAATKDGAKA